MCTGHGNNVIYSIVMSIVLDFFMKIDLLCCTNMFVHSTITMLSTVGIFLKCMCVHKM